MTLSLLQTPLLRHSAYRTQILPGCCHLGLCNWIFLCLLGQIFLANYRSHDPPLFICLLHMSWLSSRLFHASIWPASRQPSKRIWSFSTVWFQFLSLLIYNVDTNLASIFTFLSFRIKILSQHRSHLPKSSTFLSYLFLFVIWSLLGISNIHGFLSCFILGS